MFYNEWQWIIKAKKWKLEEVALRSLVASVWILSFSSYLNSRSRAEVLRQ